MIVAWIYLTELFEAHVSVDGAGWGSIKLLGVQSMWIKVGKHLA